MSRITKQSWSIQLAFASALRSEEAHRCGAVVCRPDGTVLGIGYNGPPAGVTINSQERATRRKFAIHAEQNALRLTTPNAAKGGWLATTLHPCAECVKLASAYGIDTIYWSEPLDWNVYDRNDIVTVARRLGVKLERNTGAETC